MVPCAWYPMKLFQPLSWACTTFGKTTKKNVPTFDGIRPVSKGEQECHRGRPMEGVLSKQRPFGYCVVVLCILGITVLTLLYWQASPIPKYIINQTKTQESLSKASNMMETELEPRDSIMSMKGVLHLSCQPHHFVPVLFSGSSNTNLILNVFD